MRHPFPFDPTGGYSREELLAIGPPSTEPGDFAAFWRRAYAEAMDAPLRWRCTPSAESHPEWEVFDVEYSGLALPDLKIGGWLLKPRHEPVRRGIVSVHGYGGRSAPDFAFPMKNAAVICPCCTGLPERSLDARIPSRGAQHVLHGLDDPASYVHRFCVMDVWRAASVLREAVPDCAGRLDLLGRSFGGGIGMLALPWDERFQAAHVEVPSFGHHPLRFGLPCTGAGEAVRRRLPEHPEVREVLRYFDAATAATHARVPVHVAAALFDPSVPPAGQFAVFNALAGPKSLTTLRAGHFPHKEEAAEARELQRVLEEFFAQAAPQIFV